MIGEEDKLDFQKRLGLRIVDIREAKGFTSSELARLCNLDRQHIFKLENGEFAATAYHLSKVCNGLEISLEEFFHKFE